ncbi:MAG: SDR family oxidoreductase [Chloroflexota bacterium]
MALENFDGKIALVTGGGRGIGRAIALELAQLGAVVALAARSVSELEETARLVQSSGAKVEIFPVDLTDMQATLALVPSVERKLGKVSILINNAGIVGPFGPTWTLDPVQWEQALRVNLFAPFLLARAVLPSMIAQKWGRIINISSGVAQNPTMRSGPYAPSKAGLDTFTRQLGFELDGTGVIATAIYPGIVDTVMSASVRAQEPEVVGRLSQVMRNIHAEGKMATPDYPARLVAAILTNEDQALNGQVIDIRSPEGQKLLSSALKQE